MNKLIELCDQVAISGFENVFARELKKEIDEFCDETYIDNVGNLVGIIGSDLDNEIHLIAHMDEIGLMVKKITDDGFIEFVNHCGVDSSILPGKEVYIYGREKIYGVISAKPPHLLSDAEKNKNYKIDDLYIDTGYDADFLRQNVAVGAVISIKAVGHILNNNKIVHKSLDNRFGVYTILQLGKWAKNAHLRRKIVLLFTVQEEVGLRGAIAYSENHSCNLAMVFDVTHGVSPLITDEQGYKLGSGVAIGVGPNLDRKYNNILEKLAVENDIPYTKEVMGGNTGTDAWAIQVSSNGVPTVLLSCPLRYMHSNTEMLDFDDINCVVKLSQKFMQEVSNEG